MKSLAIKLLCFFLCTTLCLATKTTLARYESSTDGSIELAYNSQGTRYQLFVSDKYLVHTCLMTCRSAELKKLGHLLKKTADKANGLRDGQSQDMGKVELDGGEFHFIAHRDGELGPWIQIMVFSSRGVDRIGFGIFGSEQATELYTLFSSRYRG